MPEYVYLLHPVRPEMPLAPTEAEERIVGQHFRYLQTAVREGRALFVGRTTDSNPLGICVFEADTEDEAMLFMRRDPAVANGVMTAELRTFHTALMRGRDD